MRLKEGRGLRTLGFTFARSAPIQAMRGVGVGLLLVTVVMLLLAATGQASISWTGGALGTEGWLLVLFGMLTFAVQGSAEEVMSSGFAMQAYARRFGVIGAIIAQAVLFTALHSNNDGIGVLPVANLMLLGILLGCWTITDGALWGVCAFHATWNWAQSKLFGTAVSGQGSGSGGVFVVAPDADGAQILTGGTFGVEGSALTTVVLGVAILVTLPRLRQRLATTASDASHAKVPSSLR